MDYTISTYRFNVTQEVVTQDGVSTTTNYTYGTTHNAPTSIQYTDSEGLVRRKQFVYPADAGSGAPLSMYTPGATFRNMLTTPIEEKTLVNGVIKSKKANVFSETGGKLYLTSTKNYPTGTTEFVEDLYAYDGNSNLISISKSTGANKIFLWGYTNSYPIAAIDSPVKYANGSTNFFYASFEEDLTNVIADAKVGRKSWKGLATYTKALTLLDPGTYVLSYFLKSGSAWNYQESTVTVPGTGNYTISIPGTPQIDELRFYPKGALMQTYAYDPGLGIVAMTNANNIVSYYVYDTFGRLKLVKNDLGEIVKVNAYNYKFK